METFLDFPKI